jgi:uncharacterized membrane protein HdeD (DUF308 family)
MTELLVLIAVVLYCTGICGLLVALSDEPKPLELGKLKWA